MYEYDGTSGNGVDVYVLDTGIKLSHPELAPRTRFGSDFTGEGEGDENGHGVFYQYPHNSTYNHLLLIPTI